MAGPRFSNGTPSGSRRIGLLGGTFDPPHHGHLEAARTALSALELDVVVLVVANDPWQKTAGGQVVTPAEVRLAMVRAAADGIDRIEVDDLEIRGEVLPTRLTLLPSTPSGGLMINCSFWWAATSLRVWTPGSGPTRYGDMRRLW